MKTDKDLSKAKLDESGDALDESQEKSLEWLLENDHADPEETLFKVSNSDYHDEGLSAFEAEIANRPLVRGNAGGDDLANYVAEEIVISSEDASGDIYAAGEQASDREEKQAKEEIMAIDFTVGNNDDAEVNTVDEGTDILGLAGDDDIGETAVVIKRVKNETKKSSTSGSKKKAAAKPKAETKPKTTPALGGKTGSEAGDDAAAGSKRSVNLTGAPVPTKVAEPDGQPVANDELNVAAEAPDMTADAVSGFSMGGLDDDSFDDLAASVDSLGDIDAEFGDLQIEGDAADEIGDVQDIDFGDIDAGIEELDVAASAAVSEHDEVEDIFGGSLEDDFALDFGDAGFSGDIDAAFTMPSSSEGTMDEISNIEFEEFEAEAASAAPVQQEPQPEPEPVEEDVAAVELPAVAASDDEGVSWFLPSHIKFSYTSQSNGEIIAEFLDAFIEEGSAEVEKLEGLIGEWEKAPRSDSLLADVHRTLHTIKGIAKGVGLQRFGTLIHNYETLLEGMEYRDAEEEKYFRIVNAWLDAVVRGLEFVVDHRVDIASELPVVGIIAEPVSEEPAAEFADSAQDETELVQVTAEKGEHDPIMSALEKKRDQQLADEGAKALAAQQSVRITSEKLDHMLNLSNQAQQLGVRASQNTTRSKRSTAELMGRLSSVRSQIGKIADRALLNVNARGGSHTELDALEMDQYSELQEAASILREGVEDLADLVDLLSRQNGQTEALLKQQSSVVSSIKTSLQGARVVPVSRMMPALRRIVRTVSNDLNKTVNFKVLNETGALDRDHYAKLQVIMEHMVRNALDHGLESPDERLAAGKPTGGRITVDVQKSGEDYVIKLSDDGKGIDPDAIRESAYRKGLDVDVDALSDEEAQRLIFHKGFSTASSLSEISGRGVGMDIVLTELQQMGGSIQIQSVVGLGTTFEMRIPSNVSVNGALMVSAAEESYAVPFNGLIAIEQVSVNDFYNAVESKTMLSLMDFNCEPAYLATLCKGVPLPDRTVWEGSVPVIIAGTGGRHMAIAIDNVEEALELVVRSLGSQFANVPGLAGAATTADGEAIVALDLNLLVSSAGEEGFTSIEVGKQEDTGLLALVVDDSRTQRMVATSQLDTVGVETITAENGLVAIDLLNAAHRLPDVVLLDVEMPVKDGIETLKEIRKSRRYGDLPVIMVTSRTGAKHRALAKEAGCNAYMGKPFNFPALVEQINNLTGADLQVSS